MAGNDDIIVLPEMNLGPLPRRRPRRPQRPVVEMPEGENPEPAPALTTELRERDLAPSPGSTTPDGLEGIDTQLAQMRQRLGLTQAPAPVVAGLDDEEASQGRIDAGLATLRNERGPLAVQRAQAIGLPGAEDSPESTDAILAAIERERTALPGIPRTQLRAPRVAPPTPRRLPGMGPQSLIAGMDDEVEMDEAEDPEALGTPTAGVVAGMDDFDAYMAPTKPKVRREIPGVQPDPADVRDQQMARRMGITQAVMGGLGGLARLIGDDRRDASGPIDFTQSMGLDQPRWADAPNARIQAREEQRRYAAEQAAEQDDRAFRRENEARRADLDARRIAQAEAATEEHARRTSAEFDVDSTDANGLREVYDATINSLPEEAQRTLGGWVDLDTTGYNARSMAAVLEQLNTAVANARTTNPRAFRQGQRAGGRRRSGGRLGGGTTGGGRGVNYGYGVQAREGGAPIDPNDPAAMAEQAASVEAPAQRPRTGGGGGAPRPRAVAPQAQAPAGQAPSGRVLWDRPPTEEEALADPTLDYKESLIQTVAREDGLDLSIPRNRRIAAGRVDSMRENTEDAIASRLGRERTPEQQRQVERYVHDYGPVHGREMQLQSLGGAIQRVLDGPNGEQIVRAALHANASLPAALAAQSREVTALRAQIYDHLNEYFHTYGGANVTDNEMMRYFAAFGAGSIAANPREFLSAVARSRRREQTRLDQGGIAYPDGARIYFETHNQRRGRR